MTADKHKQTQKEDGSLRLLNLREAGECLGVHAETVRRWTEQGVLPYVDIASPGAKTPRRRIDLADLRAYTAARKRRVSPRRKSAA